MVTVRARTPARAAAWLLAALLGALAATPLQAQTVYRIVGPDGRVTFSDQPPSQPGAKAAPAAVTPYAPGGGGGTAALPFEVRQAAARYPVTLYTAPGCAPCLSGRAMLTRRGVPFAERTVTSNEDIEALKRLAGEATLPLLTVGRQVVRGWSETDWTQFIDAAGYPKTSQLPPSWLPAPARPVVEAQARPAAPAPSPADTPAAAPAPAAPAGSDEDNPAGIKF